MEGPSEASTIHPLTHMILIHSHSRTHTVKIEAEKHGFVKTSKVSYHLNEYLRIKKPFFSLTI